MVGITAVIITLNEAHNIKDCIESIKPVCNEVIVVDSGSTDSTVEIAKALGANVYIQEFLGDGPQKNYGPRFAKNDWVLSIDADERLHGDAIETIADLGLEKTEYDGFALRRRNYIGSRWIKVCGWYPDYLIRLYNRKKTRYSDRKIHDIVVTTNFKRTKADIIHYSFRNIGELFGKSDRSYSTWAAKLMYKNGRMATCFSPFLHGASAFLVSYFFRKGFMAGVDGFTVSLSATLNSYLKYAKLLEYYRDKAVLEREDFNTFF